MLINEATIFMSQCRYNVSTKLSLTLATNPSDLSRSSPTTVFQNIPETSNFNNQQFPPTAAILQSLLTIKWKNNFDPPSI